MRVKKQRSADKPKKGLDAEKVVERSMIPKYKVVALKERKIEDLKPKSNTQASKKLPSKKKKP
jgi:hypothetical protein